jgi:carboxylesterase type B
MHDTASMVSWSEQPFVAVSFNYRLGSLGFLPSRVGAKEGILNLGLRDQILLFEWVQENIEAFGGDKNNVTLAGLSAGAHSVGHHLMRHSANNPGPFHRAIVESGAPTSRAVRDFDADIHEQQFQDFLTEVGYSPGQVSEDEIFSRLRSLPLDAIVQAQNAVFDRYNPSLRWAFQPVIDGDLIPRAPIDSWRSDDYYKVPIMTGFTHNEGSLYVDKQTSTNDEFVDFFRTLLPQLSDEDVNTIEKLYPDPATDPDKTYKLDHGMIGQVGPQYKRIEAAYAHYAYVAPVRQTAELASNSTSPPVYLYHWAAKSSVLGGAVHGDNMKYETCSREVVSLSENRRALAGTLNAYVTSFICNGGDPNGLQTGEWKDRPRWEPYQRQRQNTMIFGKDDEELVGGPAAAVPAQMIHDGWAEEQCKFWQDRVELTQR